MTHKCLPYFYLNNSQLIILVFILLMTQKYLNSIISFYSFTKM